MTPQEHCYSSGPTTKHIRIATPREEKPPSIENLRQLHTVLKPKGKALTEILRLGALTPSISSTAQPAGEKNQWPFLIKPSSFPLIEPS